MKNLSYFCILIMSFSICGCKCDNKTEEELKDTYIIIKFDDNINVPVSIISADSLGYPEYQNLQNTYQNLQLNYQYNFGVPMSLSFGNKDAPSDYTEKFNAGLLSIFKEMVVLRPIFNRPEILKFYGNISTRITTGGGTNTCPATSIVGKLPPNLQQYFVAEKCISEKDAFAFIAKLNSLGLNLTASFNRIQTPVRKKQAEEANEINIRAIAKKDDFFNFRKTMNIDLLNDSLIIKENINGKNSSIVILEHAQSVDFTHFELQRLQRPALPLFEKIGSGGDFTHATNTLGIIFSETGTPHTSTVPENTKYAIACKGIAAKANLRKIIYYGESKCGNVPDGYNAVLKAINAAEQGDILLIEFAFDVPVEYNPICHELVQAATSFLGITVIEPMGNNGENLDEKKVFLGGSDRPKKFKGKWLGKPEKPTSFAGILVGATNEKQESINNTSDSITCFAFGKYLLTTHNFPKNSYALFGETSGASAIIAGLACDMQGYYKSETGCYLTPQQIKSLFKNTKSSLKVLDKNKKPFAQGQTIPDAIKLKLAVDEMIRRAKKT